MRYAIFKEWGDDGRWLAFPIILIRMFRMEVQTKREHTEAEKARVRSIDVYLKRADSDPGRVHRFWQHYKDYIEALDLIRRGGVSWPEAQALNAVNARGDTATLLSGTHADAETDAALDQPAIICGTPGGSEPNPEWVPGPFVRFLQPKSGGSPNPTYFTEQVRPIDDLESVAMTQRAYSRKTPLREAYREIHIRARRQPGWKPTGAKTWQHWRDWGVAYLALRTAGPVPRRSRCSGGFSTDARPGASPRASRCLGGSTCRRR